MTSETLQKIGELLTPIIYALVWVLLLLFAGLFLPKEIINNPYFLPLYTIVFLFVAVSKSITWSIGHDKFGIKGDSRSKIINYHGDEEGKFWFDLFGDNSALLKDKKIQDLIKLLVKERAQENTPESSTSQNGS